MNIPEIIATDRAPSAITGSRWHACSRHMWFKFRHVKVEQHKQETLRTFEIGHAMEDLICKWIGRPVHFREAELKNLWGGTLGKIDGIIQDDEGNFTLLEMKTANAKRFKDMLKNGVPENYRAQVQLYMHHSDQLSQRGNKLQKAIFVVLCKDSSEISVESVPYDQGYAERETERIHAIMESEVVPECLDGMHCNWCAYKNFCTGDGEIPSVNCRTCANVSVKNGQFSCERGTEPCADHLFHPFILALSGYEMTRASAEENTIWYRLASGAELANGRAGQSSVDIKRLHDAYVFDNDSTLEEIKRMFDAKEMPL